MIPVSHLNRPFLPITTERLTLRPIQKSDAAIIATLANDKRVAEKTARISHPYALQDADTFVDYIKKGLRKGKYVILAVIRRSDQAFMGVVGLEEELGYWLGVDFWGQGYGKEAVRALVHFSFFTLRQEELNSSALTENTASRRILEGLGFEETGTKEMSSLGYEGKKPCITYTLSRSNFIRHYNKLERPLVWAAVAALINKEGQLLLAERPLGSSMAGTWELPGGKLE
jgi:RimJ/RimL family protein N-acetyltransferase